MRLNFQSPVLRRRARSEAGSALTEFVVVIPLFVLLLFWAEFFVDVGIVKLKVEEAARYALWETTTQRPTVKIQNELRTRFADLSSPASITSSTPIGARSFKSINVSNINIVTNIDAKFDGRVQLNAGGSGIIGKIMQGLASFIGRAVDSMVKQMGFRTDREARATVEFQVNNTLFPGGKLLNTLLDPEQARAITVRGQSPVMLIDTWKAWPGPYAMSSQNINTDVYETYARGNASAPEREVSMRMGKVAFFGQGGTLVGGILNGIVTLGGFPKPFSTGTWRDKSGPSAGGPVIMMPGEPAKHSWVPSPSAGGPVVVGDKGSQTTSKPVYISGSPEANVDRYRSTVPARVHTPFWNAEGGQASPKAMLREPNFTAIQNPYQAMYACRDAFYLGAAVPSHKRFGVKNANQNAFPQCK